MTTNSLGLEQDFYVLLAVPGDTLHAGIACIVTTARTDRGGGGLLLMIILPEISQIGWDGVYGDACTDTPGRRRVFTDDHSPRDISYRLGWCVWGRLHGQTGVVDGCT